MAGAAGGAPRSQRLGVGVDSALLARAASIASGAPPSRQRGASSLLSRAEPPVPSYAHTAPPARSARATTSPAPGRDEAFLDDSGDELALDDPITVVIPGQRVHCHNGVRFNAPDQLPQAVSSSNGDQGGASASPGGTTSAPLVDTQRSQDSNRHDRKLDTMARADVGAISPQRNGALGVEDTPASGGHASRSTQAHAQHEHRSTQRRKKKGADETNASKRTVAEGVEKPPTRMPVYEGMEVREPNSTQYTSEAEIKLRLPGTNKRVSVQLAGSFATALSHVSESATILSESVFNLFGSSRTKADDEAEREEEEDDKERRRLDDISRKQAEMFRVMQAKEAQEQQALAAALAAAEVERSVARHEATHYHIGPLLLPGLFSSDYSEQSNTTHGVADVSAQLRVAQKALQPLVASSREERAIQDRGSRQARAQTFASEKEKSDDEASDRSDGSDDESIGPVSQTSIMSSRSSTLATLERNLLDAAVGAALFLRPMLISTLAHGAPTGRGLQSTQTISSGEQADDSAARQQLGRGFSSNNTLSHGLEKMNEWLNDLDSDVEELDAMEGGTSYTGMAREGEREVLSKDLSVEFEGDLIAVEQTGLEQSNVEGSDLTQPDTCIAEMAGEDQRDLLINVGRRRQEESNVEGSEVTNAGTSYIGEGHSDLLIKRAAMEVEGDFVNKSGMRREESDADTLTVSRMRQEESDADTLTVTNADVSHTEISKEEPEMVMREMVMKTDGDLDSKSGRRQEKSSADHLNSTEVDVSHTEVSREVQPEILIKEIVVQGQGDVFVTAGRRQEEMHADEFDPMEACSSWAELSRQGNEMIIKEPAVEVECDLIKYGRTGPEDSNVEDPDGMKASASYTDMPRKDHRGVEAVEVNFISIGSTEREGFDGARLEVTDAGSAGRETSGVGQRERIIQENGNGDLISSGELGWKAPNVGTSEGEGAGLSYTNVTGKNERNVTIAEIAAEVGGNLINTGTGQEESDVENLDSMEGTQVRRGTQSKLIFTDTAIKGEGTLINMRDTGEQEVDIDELDVSKASASYAEMAGEGQSGMIIKEPVVAVEGDVMNIGRSERMGWDAHESAFIGSSMSFAEMVGEEHGALITDEMAEMVENDLMNVVRHEESFFEESAATKVDTSCTDISRDDQPEMITKGDSIDVRHSGQGPDFDAVNIGEECTRNADMTEWGQNEKIFKVMAEQDQVPFIDGIQDEESNIQTSDATQIGNSCTEISPEGQTDIVLKEPAVEGEDHLIKIGGTDWAESDVDEFDDMEGSMTNADRWQDEQRESNLIRIEVEVEGGFIRQDDTGLEDSDVDEFDVMDSSITDTTIEGGHRNEHEVQRSTVEVASNLFNLGETGQEADVDDFDVMEGSMNFTEISGEDQEKWKMKETAGGGGLIDMRNMGQEDSDVDEF